MTPKHSSAFQDAEGRTLRTEGTVWIAVGFALAFGLMVTIVYAMAILSRP